MENKPKFKPDQKLRLMDQVRQLLRKLRLFYHIGSQGQGGCGSRIYGTFLKDNLINVDKRY